MRCLTYLYFIQQCLFIVCCIGAFGRVHKADYLGTPVCVKIISRLAPDEEDYFKFTQREVAALKYVLYVCLDT